MAKADDEGVEMRHFQFYAGHKHEFWSSELIGARYKLLNILILTVLLQVGVYQYAKSC